MATPGRAPETARREHSGQRFDLDIDELSIDGTGVGRAGRQTVYVPFTIPGERVRVLVHGRPRPLATGTLVDILRASPHRVEPRCRHFGLGTAAGLEAGATSDRVPPCGGCSWQHIAYPEQLRLKTALVERLVRARVASAPRVHAMRVPESSSTWGFRQKVHFVFAEGKGRRGSRDLVMGHYARGSRNVVRVSECPVHDPRANALAFAVADQFARARIQADSGQGAALQSIVVRAARHTNELMATLVVSGENDRRLRTAVRKAIDTAPIGTSFHLNIHDEDDEFIFGPRTRKLAGTDRLRDEVCRSSYLISPTAFFQTNVAAAELLVSEVLRAMPEPPSRVLDLYAGAGLFSIPLARAGHTVTAVESNREAVADGLASARLNALSDAQCRFVVSRTETALRSAARADAAVLDPPREGCAPGVIDGLFGGLRPPVVAYVSCNPEVLAEDLGRIVGHGYRIQALIPVDMFPHTAHIETVAVLSR